MELHPLLDFGNFPIYNFMGGLGLIFSIILFIHNLKKYNISQIKKDNLVTIFGLSFLSGFFFANFLNWLVIPGVLEYNLIDRFRYAGFTFYFGLIGFTITSSILLKIYKYDIERCYNYIVPSLLLFHAFGRIGCMFAGCCFGRIIDLNIMNIITIHRFPAREIEAFILFIMFIITQFVIKERRIIFYLYIYPLCRFLLEFGRGDMRGKLFTNFLSPAQEVSLLIILIVSIYLIVNKINKIKIDKFYKNKMLKLKKL